MKSLKKIFCLLLFAAVGLAFPLQTLAVQSFAAGDPYTYTVRVFPGNNGSVSSGDEYYSTPEYPADSGTRVTINVINGDTLQVNGVTQITLDNNKYYIRGVRITGQDDVINAPSFVVTQDQDYVVAYGMRNSAVSYTVNYQDANGNPMPGTPGTNTGYGTAGKPVIVGFYPVDGYLPYAYSADGQLVQTFNLTNSQGLSSDGAENVFTFIYLPVSSAPAPGGGSTPAGGAGAGTGGGAGAGGGAGNDAAEDSAGADVSGDAAGTETEEETTTAAEEILDIDVPLADGGEGSEPETLEPSSAPGAGTNGISPALIGTISAVAAALAVLFIIMAVRRKRKENEKANGGSA